MKIATLTYQRHDNYGAMLQCYALQKRIEQMGIETEVIDYICEVSENPFGLKAFRAKGLKRYITGIIGAITRLPRAKSFNNFRHLIKMSKSVTEKNISQLGASYDGYIVGSDNVWNSDITGFDERYFLSFVADKRKRASFAASFGSSKIKNDQREKYQKFLSDFSILTCREKSGSSLINELTGRESVTVCDPTLLLTEQQWSSVAKEPSERKPYLLAYQMVPSKAFVKFVKDVAKQKNLRVVYIPFPFGFIKCKMKLNIDPLEWLGLVKNADYIITDSFHGCVFSVIFKKQFIVKISQLGERIENLLSMLNLQDRVVTQAAQANLLSNIKYSEVEPLLDEFTNKSEKKLKEIISYFSKLKTNGILNPSQCTGCLLCKSICTQNAISICRDELGFIYPHVEQDRCINCHDCEQVCSNLSHSNKIHEQKYYSAINKSFDVIKKSGSGGMFFPLADSFVKSGGVVYGAAYQAEFSLTHQEANDLQGINDLMGTKYVQSQIFDVYDKVLTNLIKQMPVLFFGTPCQVAAVKTYLDNKRVDSTNFYCCDIFCHGVFSPQIWDEYIKMLKEKYSEPIKYISFRDKKKGWRNKHMQVVTQTQDVSDYCNNEASVLRIYEQNLSLRESCYQCKYMNLDRVGDISIGDFWGIERIRPDLDKNTGVSAIIINTPKGQSLFETISSEINTTEFEKSDILQQVLKEPTKKHSKRSMFIEDYQKCGVEFILSKYGQVKGRQYLKRDILVPLLYKLHIAGFASKLLHINEN